MPAFTRKEAAAVVELHLQGAVLRSMRALQGGLRNTNLLVELKDGRRCVLRVFDRRDQPKQAAEALALRHLADASPGLPVPRVLGAGAWPDSGEPYLLLSFLPGTAPGRGLPRLGQVERLLFARALGEFMARLHSVPTPAPGFGGWLPPESHPPRAYEREGFVRALRRSVREGWLADRFAAAAARFFQRRIRKVDEDEPAVFVHHDLHADNVLVTGEGGSIAIAGVVDFEHARGRAPEYDWVMALWSLPEDGTSPDYRRLGALRRSFIESYERIRPLHPDWRDRLLLYELVKAVGFLAQKPAYMDFLDQNRERVLRLIAMDGAPA